MCSIENFLLGLTRAEKANVAITQEQRLEDEEADEICSFSLVAPVVGVDDGAHLSISLSCCSSVEAWPKHPEEDRPHHGEEVAVVGRPLLVAGAEVRPTQYPGEEKAYIYK